MIDKRIDLTNWVLHFVHRRNPDNDPAYNLNEGEDTPLFHFHEDQKKHERFAMWDVFDDSSKLAPDDYPLPVLLKILEDGHIRAGWSFRNEKPTIYGPRAATCFTEMPLYALVEYAKRRPDNAVGLYAIAILRSELYEAGGRPVIYGLSGRHLELPPNGRRTGNPFIDNWPRKLVPACGIDEQEQYRYVSMNLAGNKRIDWGHEREWRWAIEDNCSCPGLPVWLAAEPIQFSRVVIIVPTQDDADRVLDKVKELHDAGSHNFDYAYNKATLEATRVVAIDAAIAAAGSKALTMRLEDVPSSSIQKFAQPITTPAFKIRVEKALKEARKRAKAAAAAAPSDHLWGHVYLELYSPQSPLATALLEVGKASVIGGVGYWIDDFGRYGFPFIGPSKAAVEAAMEVLQKAFPTESFGIRVNDD